MQSVAVRRIGLAGLPYPSDRGLDKPFTPHGADLVWIK
jgi:hypothetical protein